MSKTQKPLAGLKVVELGTLIAGPFCTRIMAEFGAEVIKVESPDGGDPLRKWRKLYEGTSLWWYVQSRNKKSVTANLKHPEGREFVRKLYSQVPVLDGMGATLACLAHWCTSSTPAHVLPCLSARRPPARRRGRGWPSEPSPASAPAPCP